MRSILCIISCILCIVEVLLVRRHSFCNKTISMVSSLSLGYYSDRNFHNHCISALNFFHNGSDTDISYSELNDFIKQQIFSNLEYNIRDNIGYITKERRSQLTELNIIACLFSPIILLSVYGILPAVIFGVLFIAFLVLAFAVKKFYIPATFSGVKRVMSNEKFFPRNYVELNNVDDMAQFSNILNDLRNCAFNEVVLRDRLFASICCITTIQFAIAIYILS